MNEDKMIDLMFLKIDLFKKCKVDIKLWDVCIFDDRGNLLYIDFDKLRKSEK